MSSCGGERHACFELPKHAPAVNQSGFTTIRSTVEYGASPSGSNEILRSAGPNPSGPHVDEEVGAVRRRQHDVRPTSVPEQKSNQSLPTFNCKAPTFAYLFAVSEVPPITAAAGAATSSATTTIAAANSLPEPSNNRICLPFLMDGYATVTLAGIEGKYQPALRC